MDLINALLRAAPDGATTEPSFTRGFLLTKKIFLNSLASCAVKFGHKIKFLKTDVHGSLV